MAESRGETDDEVGGPGVLVHGEGERGDHLRERGRGGAVEYVCGQGPVNLSGPAPAAAAAGRVHGIGPFRDAAQPLPPELQLALRLGTGQPLLLLADPLLVAVGESGESRRFARDGLLVRGEQVAQQHVDARAVVDQVVCGDSEQITADGPREQPHLEQRRLVEGEADPPGVLQCGRDFRPGGVRAGQIHHDQRCAVRQPVQHGQLRVRSPGQDLRAQHVLALDHGIEGAAECAGIDPAAQPYEVGDDEGVRARPP